MSCLQREELLARGILPIARSVADIIRLALRNSRHRVFIYGTWASGEASERSDIDIGILGETPLEAEQMQEIRKVADSLPT